MSRKHYIAIAKEMKRLLEERGKDAVSLRIHRQYCEVLADALKADNSAFDRDRFYTACGL